MSGTAGGWSWTRCIAASVVAGGVFVGIGYLLTWVGPSLSIDTVITRQIALKGLMIVAALIAWAFTRRPWAEMGWRRPVWPRGSLMWVLLSCAAMGGASIAMVLTHSIHPLVAKLSLLQIIPVVWILSSLSEEIYVRGALQSWCQVAGRTGVAPASAEPAPPAAPLSPPVVMSALLFAGMHVPLMWSGGGVLGGGIIVSATLCVGWGCAVLRARSGSLWMAIALHVLANVAGLPGGIIGVIIHRIVYGTFPQMP